MLNPITGLSKLAGRLVMALYLFVPAHVIAELVVTGVDTYESDEGRRVTAISLRDERVGKAALDQISCAVLVDTSASQTGMFQRQAIDACVAFLDEARPDDRFSLATVDVTFIPLNEGFVSTADPLMREAVSAISKHVPLGSTDFLLALNKAADCFPAGHRHAAIVYIGDGPNVGAVDVPEFEAIIDRLRERRISFSAIGVGPRINWTSLAAVANATGGMLLMPASHEPAEAAGRRMAEHVRQPVRWFSDLLLASASSQSPHRLLPVRTPPVRGDRDTILLVEGTLEDATVRASGDPEIPGGPSHVVSLPIPATLSADDNAYLAELFRNASDTGGLFLPTLGREGLQFSRETIQAEASTLATLSFQAKAVGDTAAASRLADAAHRRDPTSETVALIHTAVAKAVADTSDDPMPAGPDDIPDPATRDRRGADPATPSDLEETIASRRIRSQQLEREIAVSIRNGRALLATAPDEAREMLKNAQVVVQESTDLDEATRQRLLSQLESRIRESVLRSREALDRQLASERSAAIGRERERMQSELQRREERIKQLVARYNALVEVGITRGFSQGETYPKTLSADEAADFEHPVTELSEAERTIGDQLLAEAPELWAQYPVPMPARAMARNAGLVARTLDYMAENYRTRRDQERGFMDALHLVDVRGIPLPDEPAIVYPSAEQWRRMIERRAKYKDATLAPESENEKAVEAALKARTNEKFNFVENSLEQLKTVIEDTYKIKVLFDAGAMQDFDLAAPEITGDFSNMALRSALRRILKPKELTYTVVDEVLLITTQTQAEVDLVRKVYPVGDLVVPIGSTNINPFNLGGGTTQNQNNPLPGGGGGGGFGNMPVCWLAREVYGVHDPRWLVVREWMLTDAPAWLRTLYIQHGPELAEAVRDRPVLKTIIRCAMDVVVRSKHGVLVAQRRDVRVPASPPVHFQIAASKARLAVAASSREANPTRDTSSREAASNTDDGKRPSGGFHGLPEDIVNAPDPAAALRAYLQPEHGDIVEGAGETGSTAPAAHADLIDARLLELRVTAAELGKAQRFADASSLLEAAIMIGHGQPWMYDALAVALEASGRPSADIDRVLLSIVDFAGSSRELMAVATMLARRGSDAHVVRLCRQIILYEPLNRQAHVLAMDAAVRSKDARATVLACAGILGIDWGDDQRELPVRAARLAKVALSELEQSGDEAMVSHLRRQLDAATVRDFVMDVSWTGDADIDLVIEEPPGTICSRHEPRTIGGGVLLETHSQPSQASSGVHRETYVAAFAFPGPYMVHMRRVYGRPTADTVVIEMTIAKGTDREERILKKMSLGSDSQYLQVMVPNGRRTVPVEEAKLMGDIVTHRTIGTVALSRQIKNLVDEDTQEAMSDSRSAMSKQSTSPYGSGDSSTPFFGRGGAVGYQPVITTLPEGLNHRVNSVVVSHDRKYVRASIFPFFSGVGQIVQFNFSGGGAQGTGQGGMGGGMGGMGGQGGMGGMGGQGGMGGMQGGGMQGGGMQGGGMQGGGMGGGFCWIAREVYGPTNPRWLLFRSWLLSADAPSWLRELYGMHGEAFAAWIHDKPAIKTVLRLFMDSVIESAASRATMPCPASE